MNGVDTSEITLSPCCASCSMFAQSGCWGSDYSNTLSHLTFTYRSTAWTLKQQLKLPMLFPWPALPPVSGDEVCVFVSFLSCEFHCGNKMAVRTRSWSPGSPGTFSLQQKHFSPMSYKAVWRFVWPWIGCIYGLIIALELSQKILVHVDHQGFSTLNISKMQRSFPLTLYVETLVL